MPFETNLTPDAHAELARQIEELAPSAQVLTSRGFSWSLATHLEKLIRGDIDPDLGELRAHGLEIKTAVSIAEAVSKRRARVVAASVNLSVSAPAPKQREPVLPIETAPKPPAELDAMSAMSMLHTLMEPIESGHAACITLLMNDGWSGPTASELVRVINAARPLTNRVQR